MSCGVVQSREKMSLYVKNTELWALKVSLARGDLATFCSARGQLKTFFPQIGGGQPVLTRTSRPWMRVSGRAVSEESARCILHEPMMPCHDTTLCQDSDARGVAVACGSQLFPTTSFFPAIFTFRGISIEIVVFVSQAAIFVWWSPYLAKRSPRTCENNFSMGFGTGSSTSLSGS